MLPSLRSDPNNIPQLPYKAFDITPGSTDLSIASPGGVTVMTKTAGDVVVTPLEGSSITLASVPAYFVIPFRVKLVSAGTTALCVGSV